MPSNKDPMRELPASRVGIQDPFWKPRMLTNAGTAIFHQWQQLEQSRCINNFRLAAREQVGFREGWFFSDSDAYKWLDAASRIYASWPSDDLVHRMNEFIALLGRAQMGDGYLYTYNQIHFPGERWGNLMIEHELYCLGHLIEAGVSHFEATHEDSMLKIAVKAADLLVRVFFVASPDKTSGHEEIEIALLRLYQATDRKEYLDLARIFLERRGKVRLFSLSILQQNARVARRDKFVREQRKVFVLSHLEERSFQLASDNFAKRPRTARLRWMFNALTGKFFQQHAAVREQTIPVGHSVRFAYLETALAMLSRLTGDATLLNPLQKSWEHMVTRRMYVTGGIGSLPELEGFGRDYELDPEIAYAETCAALGSLFWNWEMALNTGSACYSDLFEWQLYNAAAVGMGLNGQSYLYNNPLLCRGNVIRRSWFKVPCCPSNLSRTWASLGKYIYSFNETDLWVHQYIGNQTMIGEQGWTVDLNSGFPWTGKIRFALGLSHTTDINVHFRIPSWVKQFAIHINGENFDPLSSPSTDDYPFSNKLTASGYDPRQSRFIQIHRTWSPGDIVDLDFELSISLRHALPRLRDHQGKVVLTRGPLVYCLESVDNPGIDIFKSVIDVNSVHAEYNPTLLGGIWVLCGKTAAGYDFTSIPYQLWANRGASTMTVWMNE